MLGAEMYVGLTYFTSVVSKKLRLFRFIGSKSGKQLHLKKIKMFYYKKAKVKFEQYP